MQETRQYILEILRERGQATVDDIVKELCQRRGEITAVTVRHHLTRLQEGNLINAPEAQHRPTPGRPQHIYSLTPKAREYFPNNYPHLVCKLLEQLQKQLPPEHLNHIFDDIAERMAAEAKVTPDILLPERAEQISEYLNAHGYSVNWEGEDGLTLHVYNCPYYDIPGRTGTLCSMDMRLITSLVGTTPQVRSRVSEGGMHCVYQVTNGSGKGTDG